MNQTPALDKVYQPREVEARWQAAWLEAGDFRADDLSSRPPYCIVIPPPNVTGSLHMGHALDNTLQDVLIRYKRMDGFNALWVPGMDHAGIATQNVVEKQLAKQGIRRQELGREAFLEKVWTWKAESGGTILHQLKRLGASCDWERERFTLDEGLSRAVRTVFVRLHDEGLIYRGRYLINWCPRCQTALSDLEVEHRELQRRIYHLRYPLVGGGTLVVATTRPETMLGDTAVAVHPDDARYQLLIGREVELPIVGRRIPVVADAYVDPEFGSGVVKITPAHDFNDFELARRHELPMINVLEPDGRMNANAGVYVGLDRVEARIQVLERLQAEGLIEQDLPYSHQVGHCYRCDTVVEPYLSTQWFVKVAPLAESAIRAVEEGRTRILPEQWNATYFHWMRNLKDWCISRQIWWGHQIPAWYCALGHTTVSLEDPDRCSTCGATALTRDTDVLDTWFSSALWPFSTHGWPDQTRALETFYPTSVLVTGFDILFFWVARMMMMGLHLMGDVPFREVYLHALVRDELGQKMSKTRGNVIDPLEWMDKYGTDAVRFTLILLAAQGRDIKLGESRVEAARNFATKFWNAARFALMHLENFEPDEETLPSEAFSLADRWILHRTRATVEAVRRGLDEFRFNDAALALHHFIWHELCDWYLEMAKPTLHAEAAGSARLATRFTLAEVFDHACRMLHPFMPFITEEIWQRLPSAEGHLVRARFPRADVLRADDEAQQEMELLMATIGEVRRIRSEMNVPAGAKVALEVFSDDPVILRVLQEQETIVLLLTRGGRLTLQAPGAPRPPLAATGVIPGLEIAIPLAGLLDLDEEERRLTRDRAKVEKDLGGVSSRLGSEKFLQNAPADIVAKEEARRVELEASLERIASGLERLAALRQGASA